MQTRLLLHRGRSIVGDAPGSHRRLLLGGRLTPLCASLLVMGMSATLGQVHAQTIINFTSTSLPYNVGSATVPIIGLTVTNDVSNTTVVGVITGTGGTLNYTGGGPFVLGGTTSGTTQNLNMSGLSNFVFDNPTQSFAVGGRYSGGGNSANTNATLTSAARNVITASSFDVATVPNGAANNVRNVGVVALGANTTINADTINVGTCGKCAGTLTLAAGGTLVLRGTDGSSPVANWNIGTGGNSGILSTIGTVTLSGRIDAEVTNLLIGQAGPAGTQGTSGALTLGSGTLDATSIVVGQGPASSTVNATGTLTIGGAVVTTQTLTLGDHLSSSGTITGIVNLNGAGTLLAQSIQPGAGIATRTFNWSSGTVGNLASGQNMTVSIDSILLTTASPHNFDVEGADATATVSSVMSGAGGLTKDGAGILALSGDSTYTGATTIVAGTLQLGNGATSGSVVGNLVTIGTLAFDRSDTYTFAGTISGAGALTQIGTGTTILTADETYRGSTTIRAGTLQLGNGGTTGSVANASSIVDNGTLAIDHSNNVFFVSSISGTGALDQLGTGTTVLQAANTYTGGTTISAGTLRVGNGSTSGSIVGDVVDNGTLAFDRGNELTFGGTISGTGAVTILGSGATILTADNTYTGGTTITAAAGSLQLGNGGTTGSIVGNVLDDGALAINRSDTVTLAGVISGSGALSQAGTGTTILTSDNTYTGITLIKSGTLQLGNGGTTGSVVGNVIDNGTLAFNRSDAVVYTNIVSGTGGLTQLGPGTLQLEGAQTYTGPTNILAGVLAVDGSIQSNTTMIASGATLSGFGDLYADVINQGTVWPGNAIAGDTNYGTLTIHGNYVGQGGVLALNTYLGGDGSPSDVLAIDGGAATGTTGVIVHNTAPSGAETSGNGILVVSAIGGATTTADAFNLLGETREGALDYRLFRGSVDGTSAQSWYLRDDFVVGPVPPKPPDPLDPVLPPDPPPEPELPPGIYPIIGPEVATYGVVQPIARELGLLTLGTMDQRIGDSALMASSTAATDPGPSAWGRLFASNIDNTYRAFAAPHAQGNLAGFQTGFDFWQGELIPGHSDRFGGYVAYGHADIGVRGLVTNAEATNYTMQRTGSLTLHATSAGAYWTHYGPNGWYLDGVMQASTYNGWASTQDTRLDTRGVGFMGSLESGYPFALPQLGASFTLEPQVQAIWQNVRFSENNDGLGDVALGSTNGITGRVGLRGKWELTAQNGQVWEPYVAANFWRDWGGRSTTVFGNAVGNASAAPLVPQASRAELAGGVTARLLARLSVYGSAGYEHEIGNTTNARREGFNADVGMRYTW